MDPDQLALSEASLSESTQIFFKGGFRILKNLRTQSGLQIRVRIGKLFSLFLIQNICFGYSKEPSQ